MTIDVLHLRLTNTTEFSNKEYNIHMQYDLGAEEYKVVASYGRIGGKLKNIDKCFTYDWYEALSEVNVLKEAKIYNGYDVVSLEKHFKTETRLKAHIAKTYLNGGKASAVSKKPVKKATPKKTKLAIELENAQEFGRRVSLDL